MVAALVSLVSSAAVGAVEVTLFAVISSDIGAFGSYFVSLASVVSSCATASFVAGSKGSYLASVASEEIFASVSSMTGAIGSCLVSPASVVFAAEASAATRTWPPNAGADPPAIAAAVPAPDSSHLTSSLVGTAFVSSTLVVKTPYESGLFGSFYCTLMAATTSKCCFSSSANFFFSCSFSLLRASFS